MFSYRVDCWMVRFFCRHIYRVTGMFCVLGLLWSAQAQVGLAAGRWPARVTWVSDGDTVWVQDSVGATHKVRLLGIDAPEICQDHGHVAKEALQQLLLDRYVVVQGQRLDDYGRLLARLYISSETAIQPSEQGRQGAQADTPAATGVNSQDVGRWMVQRGHAWSYRYRQNPGPYVREEQRAREARSGLFSSGQAQRPRDFRRQHGPCYEPWVPHS
jgi:endonuclease YncB( thermonuclease family)